MRLGNESPDPKFYNTYYDASEDILSSALALHPGHSGLSGNLEEVKLNRKLRPKVEVTTPEPVGNHAVTTEDKNAGSSAGMTYHEAVQQAMRGQKFVTNEVVAAMRAERARAARRGVDATALAGIGMNLGVALQNLANKAPARSSVDLARLYLESRDALRDALRMDPANVMIRSNLAVVAQNMQKRDEFQLFNPHLTHVGLPGCERVLLRRLMQEQLSSTLFTCDGRTDAGLLWSFESEQADEAGWMAAFRESRYLPRAPAHDARALVWRGELCWVSGAWGFASMHMLFHCVPPDSLADQMERSRRAGELLPLLRARGGAIRADRAAPREKNWSPLAADDGQLYMIYSFRPLVVMRCDWQAPPPGSAAAAGPDDVLECATVQETPTALPASLGRFAAEPRGSSTAVRLPDPDDGAGPAFLAMGHLKGMESPAFPTEYLHFFFRLRGRAPPFRLDGFSGPLSLPSVNASFIQYGHGVHIQGDELAVTYGVEDASAWHVRLPLRAALAALAAGHPSHAGGSRLLLGRPPREFPAALFGLSVREGLDRLPGILRASAGADAEAAALAALVDAAPRGSLDDFARAAYLPM